MENQLQQSNTHQSNIVLSNREIEIAKIVYHINQLIAYPLSAIQIEDWARSLNELYPKIDLNILKNTIRMMKLGKIDFDSKKGIQNITCALHDQGIYDQDSQNNIDEYERQERQNSTFHERNKLIR